MTRRHPRLAATTVHRPQRWAMVVLVTCAIAYFILITMSSARGSQLRKLSQQEHLLLRETQDIDVDIAAESSVQQLKKRVEALGLKPVRRVEYATASFTSSQPLVASK